MEENNKLKLWESVEKTDTKYTKGATISGHKITAIDPTYQMKNATNQFGQYGSKWGLKNMQWDVIDIEEAQKKIATLSATFFTPEGEVETGNSILLSYKNAKGYYTVDDNYRKKMITNTISKELSRLGFNADVFLGMFDDERYVQKLKEEETTTDLVDIAIEEMDKIEDIEHLKKYFGGLRPKIMNHPSVMAKKDELKEKLTNIQHEDTK